MQPILIFDLSLARLLDIRLTPTGDAGGFD